MKNLIGIVLFLVIPMLGMAQNQEPCGTPAPSEQWLRELYQSYQANPTFRSDSILYVPLTIHLLANDLGIGYYEPHNVMASLCKLNNDFAPIKIQFFVQGNWNYISNQRWNDHPTYEIGREMFNQNNIPNTMNCYFLQNPIGACGYADLNSNNMALSKNCVGPFSSTWSHEMGHALSLPHTFNGWEDSDYPSQSNAPEFINGRKVERVDSSNCLVAADLFCDTPPDYISKSWNCGVDNKSTQVMLDPNGQPFKADGTLFMSYSDDRCATRFSVGQSEAMKSNLLLFKSNMLVNSLPNPSYQNPSVNLIFPALNDLVSSNNLNIRWNVIPSVQKYFLRLGRSSDFVILDTVLWTADTSVTISNLKAGRRYYYQITGISPVSFCNMTSVVNRFNTATLGTVQLSETSKLFNVYPTIIHDGDLLNIDLLYPDQEQTKINVFDSFGNNVYSKTLNSLTISTETIDSPTFSMNGIYYILIQTSSYNFVKKIIKL